jgi:hypothetical protein
MALPHAHKRILFFSTGSAIRVKLIAFKIFHIQNGAQQFRPRTFVDNAFWITEIP